MKNRKTARIEIERDVLVLVLEATEAAATDAIEVLRKAKAALLDAERSVETAQLSSDLAAGRAGLARSKVERALEVADRSETRL